MMCSLYNHIATPSLSLFNNLNINNLRVCTPEEVPKTYVSIVWGTNSASWYKTCRVIKTLEYSAIRNIVCIIKGGES